MLAEVVKKALWEKWRLDCDWLLYQSAITSHKPLPNLGCIM